MLANFLGSCVAVIGLLIFVGWLTCILFLFANMFIKHNQHTVLIFLAAAICSVGIVWAIKPKAMTGASSLLAHNRLSQQTVYQQPSFSELTQHPQQYLHKPVAVNGAIIDMTANSDHMTGFDAILATSGDFGHQMLVAPNPHTHGAITLPLNQTINVRGIFEGLSQDERPIIAAEHIIDYSPLISAAPTDSHGRMTVPAEFAEHNQSN